LNGLDEAESGTAWQRHYFTGQSPGGLRAPEHQLKLKLRDFEEIERPG
jgi:hypothetical protein